MKRIKSIILAIVIAFLLYGIVDGKRSSSRSKSSSRQSSRTTPRPRPRPTTPTHQDVDPNKIGWQVPSSNSQNTRNTGSNLPKASAPALDHNVASKSSATSLQSGNSGQNPNAYQSPGNSNGQSNGHGYNPSVGQYQPNSQAYNPSVGQQYQPNGQGYNPSVGQQYQPHGQAYNPPAGPSYQQPYGQPYNPPAGPAYQQPYGQAYNPPVQQPQTILVQQAQVPSNNRGLGQIAKEAVVFAGVNAGVNAAINRLLPGGSRSSAPVSSNTQITYNNYYNNQTDSQGNPLPSSNSPTSPNTNKSPDSSIPDSAHPGTAVEGAATGMKDASPMVADKDLSVIPLHGVTPTSVQVSPAPANPASTNADTINPPAMIAPVSGNLVTDEDIEKLSEELFKKDVNNAFKFITLKIQGQKMDDSITDDAAEPLLTVQPEALNIPTIAKLRSLYDKYELDSEVAEKITPETRNAEREFLDTVAATDVMTSAMKFVADKGLILNDEYEIKDALRRIWFSQFSRANNIVSSSGFENVFLAEKVGTTITGLHNWVYFNDQESRGKSNYLGYIKEVKLGDNAAIVKLRAKLNDIVRPVTTFFVGTSPELEMALYTVCYYVRPNNACSISLGGTKITIYTSKMVYFGKELIFLAYPEI